MLKSLLYLCNDSIKITAGEKICKEKRKKEKNDCGQLENCPQE